METNANAKAVKSDSDPEWGSVILKQDDVFPPGFDLTVFFRLYFRAKSTQESIGLGLIQAAGTEYL